ncbi:MAG: sugar transferase [Coriobacteriia bacterium]
MKRALDVIFAVALLLLASPLLLLVAAAVKSDSPGPVIFKQARLGLDGREFEFYKFRSMRVGTEKTGSGVYSGVGDERVSHVGKFIRATSIDELPQLVNIIRGDMSFVGPRPPLTYHPWPIASYDDEQRRMFLVRPGITGWAQVNGRKGVEWNERIALNIWYVNNISIVLDTKIVAMTILKVLTNADNANTGSTAPVSRESVSRQSGAGEDHSA